MSKSSTSDSDAACFQIPLEHLVSVFNGQAKQTSVSQFTERNICQVLLTSHYSLVSQTLNAALIVLHSQLRLHCRWVNWGWCPALCPVFYQLSHPYLASPQACMLPIAGLGLVQLMFEVSRARVRVCHSKCLVVQTSVAKRLIDKKVKLTDIRNKTSNSLTTETTSADQRRTNSRSDVFQLYGFVKYKWCLGNRHQPIR